MSPSTTHTSPLSQVFPDAPSGATPPESSGALFRAEVRRWTKAHGNALLLGGGITVAAAVVAWTMSTVAGIVVLGLAVLVVVIIGAILHGRAAEAFWDGYGKARGMRVLNSGSGAEQRTPLLQKGDKRELRVRLQGRIGAGVASVAQYTYTEVSRDSEGHRTETDYDFTLAMFDLPPAVAARFQGVYLRKSGLTFGGLQDKLAHDRGVELESIEFNKRYDLRVVDGQDDIAVRELFKPRFIQHLTEGPECCWEQVGNLLVVYEKGHASSAAKLDALAARAAGIYQRYIEEHT